MVRGCVYLLLVLPTFVPAAEISLFPQLAVPEKVTDTTKIPLTNLGVVPEERGNKPSAAFLKMLALTKKE